MDKKVQIALILLMVALAMFPMIAAAGTGGSEFDDVWITLTEWIQGTLGRIVAGAMVLVGIVAGIVRQSLMAFAIGIGGGIGLYNTPTVIEEILGAVLPLI